MCHCSPQALRKVPIFNQYLRLDEVQRVADVLEVVKYPAGSQIIKKGDAGTTFYIIKEGKGSCDMCFLLHLLAAIPDKTLSVELIMYHRILDSSLFRHRKRRTFDSRRRVTGGALLRRARSD